ncbi:hypothetical protein ACJX0J_008199, partial [Zea mays]
DHLDAVYIFVQEVLNQIMKFQMDLMIGKKTCTIMPYMLCLCQVNMKHLKNMIMWKVFLLLINNLVAQSVKKCVDSNDCWGKIPHKKNQRGKKESLSQD